MAKLTSNGYNKQDGHKLEVYQMVANSKMLEALDALSAKLGHKNRSETSRFILANTVEEYTTNA